MRMQSSAIRFIYNRLKEGKKETEIYKLVKETFKLPSWYISSAIVKAKSLPEDKPVVFGGKGLFEKLCKNHLQGKQREKLKREWKERRQGSLISVGSKHKTHKGNLCMRFEQKEGSLYLRVALGDRDFIYARVKREPSNERDKWNTFLAMLFESWENESYFPYTVELKLRDGEVYGFVSFDYPEPEVWLTKEYGVIAIDTNASPLHLAIAEVSKDGNLLSYRTISLHELLPYSKNRKENEEWLLAHKIVEIVKEKGKAIAVEDLKKVQRGYRGDGKAKLRKRLHYWNFKSLLSKIERIAKLNGIEVIKVHPAFTSVIGSLKYAPQLGIDKDIAGAYLIGRRALGFKEEIPEKYLKLLSDKEYLKYAICTYEEKEKELKEKFKKETNQYKRKAIKSELTKIQREKDLLIQSLQSEPSWGKEANGRNSNSHQKAWQVLRVALVLPLLERSFVRDFSPLKSILVEGRWQRLARRLVPFGFGGTMSRNAG